MNIGLLAPLAAGTLLRAAMWLLPKSFWGDEWFSIQTAQAPSLFETVRLSIADVHPPLYYVVLRWASELGGGSEAALRSVSFISGVAMLWMIAGIARRYLSPFAAAACIWITALSPYWLQSANEVRSYALMAFCVTAAAAGFLRMTEEALPGGSRGVFWTRVYTVFSVTAVYVEHYSWFWVAASVAWFAWRAVRSRSARCQLKAPAVVVVLGLPSLVLIAYQASGGEQMFVASRVMEYWNPGWMIKKLAGIFWHMSSGYEFAMLTVDRVAHYAATSPYFWACAASTVFCAAMVVLGSAALRRERPALFWTVLFAFAAPLAFLWIFYPIRLHARYLSFAAPWFLIAVAAGMGRLPIVVGRVLLAGLLCVGAVGSWRAVTALTDRVHREDYRAQMRHILQNSGPRDIVVGFEPPFRRYQRELGIPLKGRYFAGVQELTPEVMRGVERIWFPDLINMNPETTARGLKGIDAQIAVLGFRRTGEPMMFGGPEALTVLYVFDRNLA